jgi:hypothetical protein
LLPCLHGSISTISNSENISEKTVADVEAGPSHAERGEQANAAEERYDFERTNIGPRLGGLTHQNVRNDRVHGNPLIRSEYLTGTWSSFQDVFARPWKRFRRNRELLAAGRWNLSTRPRLVRAITGEALDALKQMTFADGSSGAQVDGFGSKGNSSAPMNAAQWDHTAALRTPLSAWQLACDAITIGRSHSGAIWIYPHFLHSKMRW